jgi:hypothetical protein
MTLTPGGEPMDNAASGLDGELKSSEETVLEVKRILNKDKTLDVERNTTVVAFIDQALEHHGAILLLLRSGFVGSAFALARSVTEILYRGVWFTICATDADVKRFLKHDRIDPTVATMAAAIDAACGLEWFTQLKKQTWNVLNSYAHTGMHQVGRRFDGSKLVPSYTDAEQVELLRVITSCILMLVRPFLANQGLDSAKEIDQLMLRSRT